MPDRFQTTTPLCGPLAENWIWPSGFTSGAAGEIVRVDADTMVAVAVPDTPGSAAETARIVTAGDDGTLDGAVYTPLLEMLPQLALPHETLHVTAVFVVPLTVAENCCCPPVETCVEEGDTTTETDADDWITTEAEADFVESATDVAVTVARPGFGTAAGAVYKPLEVIEPQDPETHPIPEIDQVTAVLELPVTVAVNCCCPRTDSVTELGERLTATPVEEPMLTLAVPTSEVSERPTAVTVTFEGLGAEEGAV